ncbi:MAG: hypothetical protein ACLRJV_08750 [Eubacteriales bacterium]
MASNTLLAISLSASAIFLPLFLHMGRVGVIEHGKLALGVRILVYQITNVLTVCFQAADKSVQFGLYFLRQQLVGQTAFFGIFSSGQTGRG